MKHPVENIIDALGANVIATKLGVSHHAVRKARENKAFAASWYLAIREMSEVGGVDCPECVFNFKSPSSKPASMAASDEGSLPAQKRVDAPVDCQGRAAE